TLAYVAARPHRQYCPRSDRLIALSHNNKSNNGTRLMNIQSATTKDGPWGAAKQSDGPLWKIKVLDLTHSRAGPTCVRQLVDWGGRALKIEQPGGVEDATASGRHDFDFQNLHRNKRSLTINLKEPDGLAIFKELAKDADVIVENFRPAVKVRLGVDY